MKVSVSTLREFEYCPRAVYIKRVMNVQPALTPQRAGKLVSHFVRKELYMRQPEILWNAGHEPINELVRRELGKVVMELQTTCAERLPGVDVDALTPDITLQLEPEVELITLRLQALVDEHGLKKAAEAITPLKTKCRVESEELGLRGMVDKIMNPLVPVGVKTGRAGAGVWNSDGLQVCAYGMMLEEQYNTEIPHGLVEYTTVREPRTVPFTEKLRSQVTEARDRVLEVLSGSMPDVCPHGSGRKCDACSLKDTCYRL